MKNEKRQEYFNTNFVEVYERMKRCENREIKMDENIGKLLKDTSFSMA